MKVYEITTNLPKIKFPIITRWGTFIRCVEFIFENFDKIKLFVEKLPEKYILLKGLISGDKLFHEMNLQSTLCITISLYNEHH